MMSTSCTKGLRILLIGSFLVSLMMSQPIAEAADELVIDESGDVGIGTALPTQKVHAFENANANSLILMQNPNTGTTAAAVIRAQSNVATVNFQAHASTRTIARFDNPLGGWGEFLLVTGNGLAIGTLANIPLVLGANNLQRVRINNAGVQVFGTFTNSSSREYKEDIRALTAEEALEGLKGLEPVKFRFKEQSEENLGFIAEDVPELVAVEGHKSVAPMDLIALLTKVVKEQQITITKQEQVQQAQEKMLAEQRQMLAAQQHMLTVLQTRLTVVEQQSPTQPQWALNNKP